MILPLAFSTVLMAQDQAGGGATVYKSKCAACHGAAGEGKVGPALKTTQLSEDDIVALLSKGTAGKKAPHAKPISGLTDEQIKALAHYIKSMK
jgi:ubiquinol-cytochrome c reductase cytochrome c subunit